MKLVDHIGKRFGKLTAVSYNSSTRKWLCKCDCGRQTEIVSGDLVRGRSKSCGCSAGFYRHGNSPRGKQTSEYSSWYSMIARCRYINRSKQEHYIGRGIKVCERWQKFENFLADMGPKPTSKHSIDRIDNDGNYEPGNCRWATMKEQINNRRPRQFWKKPTDFKASHQL